jgi:DNA-directed RNA polymerase subunit M/transcription elongation factor TFIIS
MDTLDPGREFMRISERYRQMSDEELLFLVPQNSELTPMAQQALASEVRQRGLKVEREVEDVKPSTPPQAKPPAFVLREPAQFHDSYGYDSPHSESSDDDSPDDEASDQETSYDEDRKLIELCTVWSVSDALKLQTVLDNAGVPFFMGPEKATGVDKVISDFAKGVSVQIMQIGFPWARRAMQNYYPADDPTPRVEEPEEIEMRCPRCHSTEVVFDELDGKPPRSEKDSPQKFKWTCDSCGNEWEDDGVVKD